jgi:co-chaperonin GroES (HSP10)
MQKEEKITLIPLFKRVIVEVEEVNPHRTKTTTYNDLNLIVPDTKLISNLHDDNWKEQEGIVDGGNLRIKFGIVQAVAEDCTKVKVGDQVVIDDFAALPVSMGIPNLRLVPEGAVLYIIHVEND